MTDQFPIYGGPLSGRHQANAATIYCERGIMAPTIHEGNRTPRGDVADYEYNLTDLPSGDRAFVPTFDDDLIAAYQSTSGEPGDECRTALLAEIERRNLDI